MDHASPDKSVGVRRLLEQQDHRLVQVQLHGLAQVNVELGEGLASTPGHLRPEVPESPEHQADHVLQIVEQDLENISLECFYVRKFEVGSRFRLNKRLLINKSTRKF